MDDSLKIRIWIKSRTIWFRSFFKQLSALAYTDFSLHFAGKLLRIKGTSLKNNYLSNNNFNEG